MQGIVFCALCAIRLNNFTGKLYKYKSAIRQTAMSFFSPYYYPQDLMCSPTHFQLHMCSSYDGYHTIHAQLHCYFYYFLLTHDELPNFKRTQRPS